MAGIPDELPKFIQAKIRRKICNALVEHLKQFDAEVFFDGEEERAFAISYFEEEVMEELVSTIATCR